MSNEMIDSIDRRPIGHFLTDIHQPIVEWYRWQIVVEYSDRSVEFVEQIVEIVLLIDQLIELFETIDQRMFEMNIFESDEVSSQMTNEEEEEMTDRMTMSMQRIRSNVIPLFYFDHEEKEQNTNEKKQRLHHSVGWWINDNQSGIYSSSTALTNQIRCRCFHSGR